MKSIAILIVLVAAVTRPYFSHAQEGNLLNQKISWSSGRSVILTSNIELNKTCVVRTDVAQNKITLDQSGRISEFTIVQYDSTWINITENGSITFTITYDEQPGTITIEKNTEETFIILDMSQNSSGVKRKFIVDQIITE